MISMKALKMNILINDLTTEDVIMLISIFFAVVAGFGHGIKMGGNKK